MDSSEPPPPPPPTTDDVNLEVELEVAFAVAFAAEDAVDVDVDVDVEVDHGVELEVVVEVDVEVAVEEHFSIQGSVGVAVAAEALLVAAVDGDECNVSPGVEEEEALIPPSPPTAPSGGDVDGVEDAFGGADAG